MGKQERIRKLTWKYFLKQKARELLDVVFIGVIMIVVPLGTGFLTLNILGDYMPQRDIFSALSLIWLIGASVLLALFMVGILLYMTFVDYIIEWIKSNWRRAKRRAQEEVRKNGW